MYHPSRIHCLEVYLGRPKRLLKHERALLSQKTWRQIGGTTNCAIKKAIPHHLQSRVAAAALQIKHLSSGSVTD